MPIKILKEKCKHNHNCPAVNSCPVGALSQKDENSPPEIDPEKCIECEMCTTMCPFGVFVNKK